MNNLDKLTSEILNSNLEELAPDYKKGVLSEEEIEQIINDVAEKLGIPKSDALAGTMLLMLKGAASSGTPQTLNVQLRDGKIIAKKNIVSAYLDVTGNTFLRRLAEGLAIKIGEFAEKFGLAGELAQRINTVVKAEGGEALTKKEEAWCSSFSQNIPDLAQRSSDRLVRLLAEDYKKRFENKKKSTTKEKGNKNPKGRRPKN